MTDTHKFCFILCSNDETQLAECMLYLSRLHIPEGYETDLVVVQDARSMAAGYNEGMAASDAKYKIYLHQDTFIVEPCFLDRLLKLFRSDKRIGMTGIIGAERLASDGVMWHEERCGNFYRLEELIRGGYDNIKWQKRGNREVEAIDGFLMATQYDLPWREDIFQGWDFYDISQCMEFRRAGYRIVVPAQKENWVIHCCGAPCFWNYEEGRRILLEEYPEIAERDKDRKRILFLHSKEIILTGLPVELTRMGYSVTIPQYQVSLEVEKRQDVESVEELLEEGHYDLVVTYDFCVAVSNACQSFGVPYYAWVYDSPDLALYDKAALNEVNYISVFDRRQYERLKPLGFSHLYYLPLAPEVDEFGGVHIGKRDEKRYRSDVAFVGRLYNDRGFEELFEDGGEEYLKEAEAVIDSMNCEWGEGKSLFGRASEELIAYMVSKEPKERWEVWNIDQRFYCESMKLARKCNEVERIRMLRCLQGKCDLVLYSDSSAQKLVPDMTVRPWLDYGAEMPKVFYLSRINLNITSRSIESGVPQRVWDILAVGGFCLTNYQPELEEYFEIGRDLEVWHDLAELEEKVQYYLSHEEQRVRIAINGYQKVKKYHSLQMRLEGMMQNIFGEEKSRKD